MWITNQTIALACDHAGFELKEFLKDYLRENGLNYIDFGTHNSDSCDYPDFAHKAGNFVQTQPNSFGIVICGSANGVNMVVNKYPLVRSALCWQPEIALLARQHNDANILALPARFINHEIAIEIVKIFFTTNFEGGRHQKRIDKIPLK